MSDNQPLLFSKAYPQVFARLDFERNASEGIDVNSLFVKKSSKIRAYFWCLERKHSLLRLVDEACYRKTRCKECNLFINHKNYPILEPQWDYEKNDEAGIKINEITYGSSIPIHWKCQYNHEYISALNGKTGRKNPECPICVKERIKERAARIIQESKEAPKHDSHFSTQIGDDTEKYIQTLLTETGHFTIVDKLGVRGGNADLKVTYPDGTSRYIQVKTLSKNPDRIDSYRFDNVSKYPSNMVMAMSNKQRTRFAVGLYADFSDNKVSVSLTYNSRHRTKRDHTKFLDKNAFIVKLLELIPQSCEMNEFSPGKKLEVESLERFQKYCENNDHEFKWAEEDFRQVDGYFNGKTFQAKFISLKKRGFCFEIDSGKVFCVNKLKHFIPYEVGDFDMMIIEFGGDVEDPNKYKGRFCIIPAEALVEQHILKNDEQAGKISFSVYPPDYAKPHWTMQFWV